MGSASRQRQLEKRRRLRITVILGAAAVILGGTITFFRMVHGPIAARDASSPRAHEAATTVANAAGGLSTLKARSTAAIAARGRAVQDAGLHLAYVRALEKAGDWQEALQFTRRWLHEYPDNRDFLAVAAALAERVGQYDSAITHLARLARLDESGDWRFQQARLEARAGRVNAARQILVTILEADPGHTAARALLADLDLAGGNLEAAHANFVFLLSRQPDNLVWHAKAAECLVELAEYEEALARHNAAASRPDAPADLYFHVAQAHLALGQFQPAADLLADTLMQNPFHARAYSLLAMACRRLNNNEAARNFADAFVSFDRLTHEWRRVSQAEAAGHLTDAALRRGQLFLETGRYFQAGQALTLAVQVGPDHPEPYRRLAHYWRAMERPDRAADVLRKALDGEVGSKAELQVLLGQCLLDQRRFAKAERAFEAALAIEPHRAEAAAGLAEAVIEREEAAQLDRVAEALESLSASAMQDWRIAYWLGRAALLRNEVEPAAQYLAEAVKLTQRRDAKTLGWLGAAVAQMGRPEQAGPILAAATQLDPVDPQPLAALAEVFDALDKTEHARKARQRHSELHAWQERRRQLLHKLWESSGPQTAPAYVALGRHYLSQGQGPKAQVCLMLAWQIDPSLTDACRLVAQHMTSPKDFFVRAHVLNTGLKHAPEDAEMAATLAQHLASAGLKPDYCRQLLDQTSTQASETP